MSSNAEFEGQISIDEILDRVSWCGKMSREPLVPTKEKTSASSSKKPRTSQIKPPLFLDLRTGENGQTAGAFWVTGGLLLGVYMMHSFGEFPNEERESRLSQILEDSPHPKYYLSAKACQGILNRAGKRGKKLPEKLETALRRQATASHLKSGGGREVDSSGKKAGKGALIQTELSGTLGVTQDQTLFESRSVYGICSYDSNSMKSKNPNSGIYEAKTSRTLDLAGGSPACNQGGMIVLEGNGSRESHKGDGYKESETMFTLNTVEQHGVCYEHKDAVGSGAVLIDGESWDGSQVAPTLTANNANGSQRMPDKQNFNVILSRDFDESASSYGLDRASFNQGKNAKFDFAVDEEISPPLVARGPGGVMSPTKTTDPSAQFVQETIKE